MLFVCHPKICISIVFNFSWELKWPQEKLNTMLRQTFGVTNKEHYGMLWYFLEWSIGLGLMTLFLLETYTNKVGALTSTLIVNGTKFISLCLIDLRKNQKTIKRYKSCSCTRSAQSENSRTERQVVKNHIPCNRIVVRTLASCTEC